MGRRHTTVTGRIVYDRERHPFSDRDVERIVTGWADLDTDPVMGILKILGLLMALAENTWRSYADSRILGFYAQLFFGFMAFIMSAYQRYAIDPMKEVWKLVLSLLGPAPSEEPPESPQPPI